MMRILILEDNAEARRSMAELSLSLHPEAEIRSVALVAEAMAEVGSDPFDLALIDLSLPDGEGLSVIRCIKKTTPDTICVVTTGLGSDSAVVSALAAGANGYLLKTDRPELTAKHLADIELGVPVLSPSIARRIMSHFSYTGPVDDREIALTNRETEVLTLIARGLRVSETAQAMGIAESTVSGYVKSIYRKLDISSRAEATFEATRLGLLRHSEGP